MHHAINITMTHNLDSLDTTSTFCNKNITELFQIDAVVCWVYCVYFFYVFHIKIYRHIILGSGNKVKVYLAYGYNFVILTLCTVESILDFVTKQTIQKKRWLKIVFSTLALINIRNAVSIDFTDKKKHGNFERLTKSLGQRK